MAVETPLADADATAETYDLQGRQVQAGENSLRKGIYVRNGKKFVVK